MSFPQDLLSGTAIAVVNAGDTLRVFAQDTALNIRQSFFQDGMWSGGNSSDIIGSAKQGSPLAACSGNGTGRIRVFYINSKNILQEKSWDTNDEPNDPNTNWVDGPLNAKAIHVAPNSDIATFTVTDTFEALRMCIYFQAPDSSIQEYYYQDEIEGWIFGQNWPLQLPGTKIAAFTEPMQGTQPGPYHVFFQDHTNKVVEHIWDANGWGLGGFSTEGLPPASCCALAAVRAVGFPGTQVIFRLYYQDQNNNISEMTYDTPSLKWYWSVGKVGSIIQGGHLAAAEWQGATLDQNRIYFQDGSNGTAISEYKRGDDEWVFQNWVPPLT